MRRCNNEIFSKVGRRKASRWSLPGVGNSNISDWRRHFLRDIPLPGTSSSLSVPMCWEIDTYPSRARLSGELRHSPSQSIEAAGGLGNSLRYILLAYDYIR